MSEMPIVELKSGLKVGNFSSPHSFHFDDGTVLPGCEKDRSSLLMLNSVEIEHPTENLGKSWVDVELSFAMTETVHEALEDAMTEDVDIIIVPLPVLTAAKAMAWDVRRTPFRTCRLADRVTKLVCSDRFCI